MRRQTTTAVTAFVAMEPAAYAAHRFVMHKVGWALHRSHHVRSAKLLEANDAFPTTFAALAVTTAALASRHRSLRRLKAVVAGVTAYGAAYGFVHDGYIHARFGHLPPVRPLEYLKQAHRLHHLFGGEPYGMLFPVVPAAVRQRAARLEGAGRLGASLDRGPAARGTPSEAA